MNIENIKGKNLNKKEKEKVRIKDKLNYIATLNIPKDLLLALIIYLLTFIIFKLYNFSSTFFLYLNSLAFIVSYFLVARPIIFNAFKNMIKGHFFDENFLMTLATLAAIFLQQYGEAVAVMLFFRVGELFQDRAIDESRNSIKKLINIKANYANLKVGDELKKIDPENVKIGDIILIKAGEKVPVDGIITQGESFLDTSVLTGESVPIEAKVGDEILSGMINLRNLLTIKVTKEYRNSTVANILNLVEKASNKKARIEQFITKFAHYYTPVVVFLALIIAILPAVIFTEAVFSIWLYRALIFLVISCPCALVVSIPLSFYAGIGLASRQGILLKGGNYLEALNYLQLVVFDKTGTLTKGKFKILKVESFNQYSKNDVLKYAAIADLHSNHPIAKSIIRSYGQNLDKVKINSLHELAGYGNIVETDKEKILLGNEKLLMKEKIKFKKVNTTASVLYLAVNNVYAGYIIIGDQIKNKVDEVIKDLKKNNIKKVLMVTGDKKEVAKKVAFKLGLDDYYAELLPGQKVEIVERLIKKLSTKGKLAFIGDGINDAPVLMRADIGIAMGGFGSDAAIEAADMVLMTDDLSKINTGIKIAQKTKKIVYQNIILALGFKGIILILGVLGLATMWQAVFADVGVTLLAVLNTLRITKGNI